MTASRLRIPMPSRLSPSWSVVLIALICTAFQGIARAQDRTVLFESGGGGVSKSVTTWGMGTIGGYNVMMSGIINMGADEIDVVIMPFALEGEFVNGTFTDLTDGAKGLINDGMGTAALAGANKPVILSAGNGPAAEYITGPNRVHVARWVQTMIATKDYATQNYPNQSVSWMQPFNEPDYGPWNFGNGQDLFDIISALQGTPSFSPELGGAANLNVDTAPGWYNTIKSLHPIGTTHAISGSVDSYVNFLNATTANGDIAFCPELHCLGEAIIGAEYGMDGGIYWLRTDRARGSFTKACQGMRLGYAEHRANWTAAAVYRTPGGAVQAFLGGNERVGAETSYRFVSKDRDVFYNGEGPRRDFTLSSAPTREQVMNITWGADVQPPVNGRYIVVNRKSQKAMEVVGASTADNANIQQNTYSGSLHQQWDIAPHYPGHGDHSYFKIAAAHSGKIADAAGHSYNDGANVTQWTDVAEDYYNRHWFLEYVSDGYFYIRNRWSGKYLEVAGASTSNGANIQQWGLITPNSDHQQWRLIPADAAVEFNAPATPTGLAATANAVSINLTWNANAESDLAGYTVFRSTTNGGPYDTIARGVTTASYTDNAANQTTPYYYVVKAVDRSLNRSANSAQVSATPTGANTLVARYAFDGGLNDSSGNANHGALNDGVTAAYGSARTGTASVVLGAAGHQVHLPPDVASFDQMTVATWVYWNGGSSWQRIFDFGNQSFQYMFLSPNASGGGLRFAIKNGGAEQQLNTSTLATGQWVHVAVTLGTGDARLYVNGTQVASSAAITIKPSDFKPVLNYIGRSQFDGDPLFSGKVDDFQIYNHVLSAGQVSALASVAPATSTTPLAHLKFDETSGATALDSAGNGWNAALVNAPAWVTGRFENAIDLPATGNPHLTLPGGIVTGLADFTVSTWVNVTTQRTWARIFDFGTATTPTATAGAYMNLAASNGSVPVFNITTSGYNNEQRILGTGALPVGSWCHVAVTLTGTTGRLYVNGALVGTNNAMTLKPSSLGLTTQNYLGRSQYAADAYLNGSLDDFRVYAHALSAGEVAALAAAPASHTPAFTSDPFSKPDATTAVAYSASIAGDATDSDAGDTLTFSKITGPSWLTVAADGTLGGTPPAGSGGINTFTVRVTDTGGLFAEATMNIAVVNTLPTVYLKMNEVAGTTTADESGYGWTGTLVNGPTRTTSPLNRAISLDGSNDHVTLPAGVVSSLNDCTLSIWVRATSLVTGSRVFDFGTGTTNYLFLTPKSSTGNPRFAIRTSAVAEQVIDSSAAFTLSTWNHLAVTLSGSTGTLYLNGTAVGTNASMSLNPADLGNTTQNYFGRSQASADYFGGFVDEFQAFDHALTPAEISALAAPPAAPAVTAAGGLQRVTLAWSAVPGAASYGIKRATLAGGPYATIVTGLTSPGYIDTGLTGGATYHYTVSAKNQVTEGANSATVSAMAQTAGQAWRQANFGTTANTGNAADGADPEGDGVVNLLERAFGGNPNAADPSILPAIDDTAPLLSITYRKALAATDLTFAVRESADLASWAGATGTSEELSDDGTVKVIRFTAPLGEAERKFLRVEVTGP